MAVNEFEDNVQQNLVGLQLTPSAEVWNRVEAEIRKEKKRRMIVFLLLFLFAFFAGGLFYMNNENKKRAAVINSIDKTITDESEDRVAISHKNNVLKKLSSTPDIKQLNTSTIQNTPDIILRKTNNGFKTKRHKETSGENEIVESIKNTRHTKAKFKNTIQSANAVSIEDENKSDTTAISVQKDSQETALNSMDSSSKIKKLLVKDTASKKLNNQIAKNNVSGKKWNIGLTFDIGRSSTPGAYFTATNGGFTSGIGGGGGVSGAGGNPTGNLINSAKPSAGIGFSVGIFAMKNISTKTNLVAGINYQMLSTITNTNTIIINAAFDSAKHTNKYTSQFHFIQIPIEVQSKIGNGKKMPLYWSAGIVLSQLISTNALQYNNRGIYYSNNSLFNKTGVGLTGGLFWDIEKNNKPVLQIGPDFYYSLSTIANTGIYGQSHYNFIGIRLRKLLTNQ